MGNLWGHYEPYTIEETEKETNSGNKNAFYWFGVMEEDIAVYELMEYDDD